MSKIKTLLQLIEDYEEHDCDGCRTGEFETAIREAKLEHEQLVACINRFSPSAFRDIAVFNELKRLV